MQADTEGNPQVGKLAPSSIGFYLANNPVLC